MLVKFELENINILTSTLTITNKTPKPPIHAKKIKTFKRIVTL